VLPSPKFHRYFTPVELLEKYTGYELAHDYTDSGRAVKLAVQLEVATIVTVWQNESQSSVSPIESRLYTNRHAV
jgi:hypothetical protein